MDTSKSKKQRWSVGFGNNDGIYGETLEHALENFSFRKCGFVLYPTETALSFEEIKAKTAWLMKKVGRDEVEL